MSNIDTLDDFLKTINDRNFANYHSVGHLITLFSPDDPVEEAPSVGIAWRGPQFKRRSAIQKLFAQLLEISFEDMAWKPANNLRMTDGDTIAVEIDVTAKHVREWFTDSFHSPPLSLIDQKSLDELGASKKSMDLPACAVFTFDGNHKIRNLAIYIDRYRMIDQLAPSHWTEIGLPGRTRPVPAAGKTARSRRVTITIED